MPQAAASLCLNLTRELDAARIVTTACMAAIADAVLRKATIDTSSVLSDHYAGRMPGPILPFGVDHHPFASESETLKFTEPQLIVARGMCLDYFASIRAKVCTAAVRAPSVVLCVCAHVCVREREVREREDAYYFC